MKQKIVIRVSMINEKTRSRALQVAVGVSGVESVALTGGKMDQVEIVGENIDAVMLTRILRKKVACAELVTLQEAKKPKEKEDKTVPVIRWSVPPYPCFCREVRDPSCFCCEVRDPSCTIM